jgi:hypothetical protein
MMYTLLLCNCHLVKGRVLAYTFQYLQPLTQGLAAWHIKAIVEPLLVRLWVVTGTCFLISPFHLSIMWDGVGDENFDQIAWLYHLWTM